MAQIKGLVHTYPTCDITATAETPLERSSRH